MFEEKKQVETGFSFDEESVEEIKQENPEAISLSLFENGLDFDQSFVDKYVKAKEEIQINGSSQVEQARIKAKKRQIDDEIAKAEGTIESLEDLQTLDEKLTVIDNKGLDIPANWKTDRAKGNLRTQSLMRMAEGDLLQQQRFLDLETDIEDEIFIKQEIEKIEYLAQKEYDEAGAGELILDFLTSAVIPGSDIVNLRLQAEQLIPGHSLSGEYTSTQVLNSIGEAFKKLSPEQQREVFLRFPEVVHEARSQLGLGENVLLNTFTSSLFTNTLKEAREDGEGFLGTGIKTSGDVGVAIFDALEVAGASQLANFFGRMVRKAIGRPTVKPTMTKTTGRFQKMLEDMGESSETPPPVNPETTGRRSQGSLFDVQKLTDPESIGKMLDETPSDKIDIAFESLGIDRQKFVERWMPQFDDALDSTALPPSAYSPELSVFMRTMKNNNNLTLIGYQPQREEVMKVFQEDFIASLEGYEHPSRSFIRPPVEGDTESLGTVVMRYGASPEKGFENPLQAVTLASNLKGQGHTAKLINTEDGIFVEVQKTHVLSSKDALPFSSTDGSALTTWFGRGAVGRALNPSSYTIKVSESLHPQRIASFGVDSGAALSTAAADVRKAYTDLKSSSTRGAKLMARAVDDAIEYSESIGRNMTSMELHARFPDIGIRGEEAYNADRNFWEAVRFVRAKTYRRELASKGYKSMTIGQDGFYGKVIADKPTVKPIPKNENGNPIYNDKMETDNAIYGVSAYDPIAGQAVSLSEEFLDELYTGGGRVIQLRQLKNVAGEDFSHMVVRDLYNLKTSELPPFVDFGIGGYSGSRRYKDVQYKVVWSNKPSRLNGEDINSKETLGVVSNRAEANKYIEYAKQKWPDRNVVLEESRELKDALDLNTGGEGFQTYMRRRAEERPTGKIVDGQPTEAKLLDGEVSFQQDMWSIQSEPLMRAVEMNEARFVKQYGKFFKDGMERYFPTRDLSDVWDKSKLEKELTIDQIQQVKKDASQIQWYIKTLRSEAMREGETFLRSDIANLARKVGASDNVVAEVASKTLMDVSKMSAAQQVRGWASSMYISMGVLFQVPQNLLNAAGLVATQGTKGMQALSDLGHLAYSMMMRDRVSAYNDSIRGQFGLAWKLNTTPDIADQFVKRAIDSGIFGNAGEVDNMLRHVSEVTSRANQMSSTARRFTTQLPSSVARGASYVVSKSIDTSMLYYWSAAFRKNREIYEEAGDSIGTDDFWESTRQLTRKLSQNQNSSDILNFEKRTNPLAFAMQFSQHIIKQGNEVARIGAKALGFNVQSAFAGSRGAAWKALGILFAAFGGSMFGRNGVTFVHENVPDNIANPTTEAEKAILAFLTGGAVDLMLHGFQVGVSRLAGEEESSEYVVPYSHKLSPLGGSVDMVSGYYRQVGQAIATGELDIELLSTFGGAGYSAMQNVAGIAKLYPRLVDNPLYDSADKLEEGLLSIGKLAKSFSDTHQAWIMWNYGNQYAKTSGRWQGSADGYTAIAKAFGFDSIDVINRQNLATTDFFTNARLEDVAQKTVKDLTQVLNNTLVKDVRNKDMSDEEFDKRWMQFVDYRDKLFSDMIGLGLPDYAADRYARYVMEHWSYAVADSPELIELNKRLTKSNIDIEDALERYERQPGTSKEDAEQARKAREALEGFEIKEEDK